MVIGEDSRGEKPAEKKTDETWKERAQREKEKLAGELGDKERPPPQASFLGLVEEISLRAMLALGQLRNPATGEVYFDLDAAKYSIDLLDMLEQKTRGNLEPAEKQALEDVLHQLRLVFVHVSRNPPRFQDIEEGDALGEEPPARSPESPGPKIIL